MRDGKKEVFGTTDTAGVSVKGTMAINVGPRCVNSGSDMGGQQRLSS